MLKRLIFSSLITLLPVFAISAQVHEITLKNGLRVIVKEDHRAPVVVSQIWYKVGSSYESNGITGVSHVLEHMMFKGTKRYGPNEFSRIISENGGRENAFTGQDYTAYFQQLEKSRLPIAMELESDRMRGLILAEEEFVKEIKVVMEERRMRTDDKPRSLTYEHFNATAFINSPYHNPIIGWMDDLENMKIQDLRRWYQVWYAPNNATLVIIGDVNPQEVFALAKKYYGDIKPSEIKAVKPQREVEQKGVRRIKVKAPAELPYLVMGYKVPVVKTSKKEWEPYALSVLASILDGGASARFSKTLIRDKQIAASAGASYDPFSRIEDLFVFDGTPSQDYTVKDLEAAIHEEIDKLRRERVSQDELERIKAQEVASKIYEKDSIFYQAMQIGQLETVGLDWKLMDEYVEKVRSITPEQVQWVAQKYLIEDRLTIGILEPTSLKTKNIVKTGSGGSHAN